MEIYGNMDAVACYGEALGVLAEIVDYCERRFALRAAEAIRLCGRLHPFVPVFYFSEARLLAFTPIISRVQAQ
jgi:hypothetical protein